MLFHAASSHGHLASAFYSPALHTVVLIHLCLHFRGGLVRPPPSCRTTFPHLPSIRLSSLPTQCSRAFPNQLSFDPTPVPSHVQQFHCIRLPRPHPDEASSQMHRLSFSSHCCLRWGLLSRSAAPPPSDALRPPSPHFQRASRHPSPALLFPWPCRLLHSSCPHRACSFASRLTALTPSAVFWSLSISWRRAHLEVLPPSYPPLPVLHCGSFYRRRPSRCLLLPVFDSLFAPLYRKGPDRGRGSGIRAVDCRLFPLFHP